VGTKRKRGSAVVWTPPEQQYGANLSRQCRGAISIARQVQVRGWSESPERAVQQLHWRAGAFAGPDGRSRWRRADAVKSMSYRVRRKEVGMVSNQMEADRHAQE
jgi:hypothetical protein